jgi:hypothetical protein
MMRIPIPKGLDKPGQTRPISLADDVYSFLTAQISRTFAEGMALDGWALKLLLTVKAYPPPILH